MGAKADTMADERPLKPRSPLPEKIGRYRILRLVGRGAMGVVYAAEDELIGRVVGLKVLMADLEGDPETRARFQREAQAAARLLHPNIITIFDAGQEQGRSFIAMQLLEGWPLADYMKRPEAAPLERKLDLMVQMCEGLAAAHGQGVIHRDLKPNNLFVQADGLLKIYDFGVARIAESNMTAAGAMIGTPDYMSPEQARGAQVDARSDLFSAGAVFYFMLTGRKPFPGPDLPAVLRQLQFDDPAPIGAAAAPAELATIVLRAMSKNPDDRPPRIQEVLTSLVRYRRQYQSETRRIASTARSRYEQVEKLAQMVADAAAPLELPTETLLGDVAAKFPLLANPGAGLDPVAVDRAHVTAVLHELEAERQRLATELDHRRARATELSDAERLLATGDARAALRLFEAVSSAYPAGRRARVLAEECIPQAREQEAREQRVQALMSAARRAIDAREWATAIARCEEALAVIPRHDGAIALLNDAHQSIEREKRRQELLLQRVCERASRAIDTQDFEGAEAALREAEAMQPDSSVLLDLRRRLTEAEAAAEAANLLRQMSADEIRRARAQFRRGQQDEAIQELRAFLDVEPDAREAEAELDRLVALREHHAELAAARHRRVAQLMAAANALADQRQLTEALTQIREAMRIDPSDLDAAGLYDELMERELKQRVATLRGRALEQRHSESTPLLAAAREASARGYLSAALAAAVAACRVAPERADAAAFAEEMRRAMAAEDTDLVELGETPFVEPTAAAPRPATEPRRPQVPETASGGGVFAQMNQWAADLLRRKSPKSSR